MTGSLLQALPGELLALVAEPETPEARDAAWNEITRRLECTSLDLKWAYAKIEALERVIACGHTDKPGRTQRGTYGK